MLNTFVFLYSCVRASPLGWLQWWTKHVENFVNKILHKYSSTFVGYLHILGPQQ
jgi:hypothetical protein